MLLPGEEICRRRVWMVFGKGENMGFMGLYLLFPTHFGFFLFYLIWGKRPLVSHLHPCGLGWAFYSGGLPTLAGPCRSLGGVKKFRVVHFTLLIIESMSDLVASETSTCKCLRCLCHSDSNLYITLRDSCIILCSLI